MTESAISHEELAWRILSGDKAAESELYMRFQSGVRQIIARITGNFALAEELSHETVIVALKRLRSVPLEDPSKLPAFIAQTARNLAIAEKRKETRRRTESGGIEVDEVAGAAPAHECQADAEWAAGTVRAILRELPSERDRRILVRHYLQDDDRSAICRDLGIDEARFHLVLFRARKRFLERLERRGIRRADVFSFVLA
jgi:RNA polymerase sigma-70 factor (ECF subfamily)